MAIALSFKQLVDELCNYFGPQQWWPSDSPFETILGAILTQNTAWKNVELALTSLKEKGLIHPARLASCPEEELEQLIRPAGYFRQKTIKIKIFLNWYLQDMGGDHQKIKETETNSLRDDLLALWGIGPETADAILCYALDHPVFVNDAYTMRVLLQHRLIDEKAKYGDVQKMAHAELPSDLKYLKDAHALFVSVGKEFCHKKTPDCANCPLGKYL